MGPSKCERSFSNFHPWIGYLPRSSANDPSAPFRLVTPENTANSKTRAGQSGFAHTNGRESRNGPAVNHLPVWEREDNDMLAESDVNRLYEFRTGKSRIIFISCVKFFTTSYFTEVAVYFLSISEKNILAH